MNADLCGHQPDISLLLLSSHAISVAGLKAQAPPLVLEARKVCWGEGEGSLGQQSLFICLQLGVYSREELAGVRMGTLDS